jgi:hypothetical protein
MINLNLPALVEPQLPADPADGMAVESWKMARRTYNKKFEARNQNEQRIYALTPSDNAPKHHATEWRLTMIEVTPTHARASSAC